METKPGYYTFTSDEVKLLQKPCIYFVYASDGEVAYIGVSSKGASRAIYPNHERLKLLVGPYSIGCMTFDSEGSAKAAEALLIAKLRPRLNRYIPSEKVTSEAARALPGHPE